MTRKRSLHKKTSDEKHKRQWHNGHNRKNSGLKKIEEEIGYEGRQGHTGGLPYILLVGSTVNLTGKDKLKESQKASYCLSKGANLKH